MSCKLVAEIGINHNGSIDLAKKLMDMAHSAGCNYVKFQKRTVDLVYSKQELDKYRESPWGTTNRQQKQGLEFGPVEYEIIDNYLKLSDMSWFASPWDVESVRFLNAYYIPYIKVASAKLTDMVLLEKIRSTKVAVILSTGMSTKEELDRAINILGDQIEYILACTSSYPTKDEDMNLNFIKTLKSEYPQYKIGFSNHSPGIIYSCIAASMGAEMIEFHITLDRSMYGSDQSASIESGGVYSIVKHVQNIEKAMGSEEWIVTPDEEIIKAKLRR